MTFLPALLLPVGLRQSGEKVEAAFLPRKRSGLESRVYICGKAFVCGRARPAESIPVLA